MKILKTTEAGLIKFDSVDAVSGNILAEMLEVEHRKLRVTIEKVIKYEENRKFNTDKKRRIASEQKQKFHCLLVSVEIIHIEEEKNLNFNAVFKDWEYKDSRGRTQKTYIMNEDALYLVIANTKGQKAHELKVLFKSEFNKMKIERKVRVSEKAEHRSMTDALKDFYINHLAHTSTRQTQALFYCTIQSKIRKRATGKSKKRGTKNNHDDLTVRETAIIEVIRQQVPFWIKEALEATEDVKEARSLIYEHIKTFNPVCIIVDGKQLLDDRIQAKPKVS